MLTLSPFQRLRMRLARIPALRRLYDVTRTTLLPNFREDGLATTHNCDFVRDPAFVAAYEAALRHEPDVWIRWRAHVLQWAGFHALHLPGDFVECGVNRGFLSASVMAYVDFAQQRDRRFYLFDTYCGLVESQVSAEDRAARRNYYPECYDFVVQAFSRYTNAVIVRGVVPDSLATVSIDRVAYLSIDMNCVEPERAALEHFWPKMVPGGIAILDDYGFPGHEAQKLVADRFAAEREVRVLTLPTGQGMLLKP